MSNPYVRLLIRALAAGIGAFAASYTEGGDLVRSIVWGLGAAAALASAELGTPLNPLVGPGKDAELVDTH